MTYVPAPKTTFQTSGTISALDQEIVLDIENCSGGILTIDGTFTGILELTGGAVSASTVYGGRVLFKSGVGSTGRNIATGFGDLVQNEIRYVAGGSKIRLKAISWTSGSIAVGITAQAAPTNLFINGPVHTSEEQAVRDARCFSASSGVEDVLAGNVLIVTLQNPVDSGTNIVIKSRRFTNNRSTTDDNLEFIGYANPTYEPTNLGVSVNLFAGGGASQAVFRSEARPLAGLVVGGSEGLGEILPRGEPDNIDFDFMVPPGGGLGILIQGAGNNIANAVRMSIGLRWYEEFQV